MTTVLLIIAAILGFFLVLPFLTVLMSRFTRDPIKAMPDPKEEADFGCIITAYKNHEITKPGVQALLKQRYKNFHIYVLCDNCEFDDYGMEHEKLTVFLPDPPLNLKAKSIIYAMDGFVRKHSHTMVFDADNLAHPDFLKTINRYIQAGHRSVQGQRTAKNLDTLYACADATGEFYKNYIERLVPYLIGSSSVISGSGMAVKTDLYRGYLDSPEIQQGKEKWKKMLQEDKILQNFLLRQNEKISYAWDAIVYDEKVTTGDQVETQRSRWLYSYFQNLPNSIGIFRRGIFGLRWNQLLFGLITFSPPLFILLFTALAVTVIALFINWKIALGLATCVAIFALTILWTLKLSKAPEEIWKALWGLPLFVIKQITALFKMSDPNKNFKHTEHDRSYSIDEVLEKTSEK